jgi:pyridoxal phosphate enzyme (YggS family)
MSQIAENLAQVQSRVAEAALRSGRRVADIRLVAVTKTVGPAEIRALVQAGCSDLGESRPQQLWQRAGELADLPIRWHVIGHLQRNKIRRTLPLATLIHSADSRRLVEALDESAADLPRPAAILLEVNTSGEPAKSGFQPVEIEPLLPALATLKHVTIQGLMCMASLEGGLDVARRDFTALRELRDRLRRNCPAEIHLDELSMGMSGDFETAVEEGATIVRVGTALFEGVSP